MCLALVLCGTGDGKQSLPHTKQTLYKKPADTEEEFCLLLLFLANKTGLMSRSLWATQERVTVTLEPGTSVVAVSLKWRLGSGRQGLCGTLPAAPLPGRFHADKREPDERGGDVSRADGNQDGIPIYL